MAMSCTILTSQTCLLRLLELFWRLEKTFYTFNLGIQSDVPGEVSEVAHQIVRLSRVDGIDFKVSEVHIGLAGDCIEPNSEEDDEKVPDLVTLQGIEA